MPAGAQFQGVTDAARRAHLRRTPQERVRLALEGMDDFYAALLAEETRAGASREEAVARVRAKVRAWRAA